MRKAKVFVNSTLAGIFEEFPNNQFRFDPFALKSIAGMDYVG